MSVTGMIKIGPYTVAQIAPRDGRKRVWIQHDNGEGGEFDAAKLETILAEFFTKEF